MLGGSVIFLFNFSSLEILSRTWQLFLHLMTHMSDNHQIYV